MFSSRFSVKPPKKLIHVRKRCSDQRPIFARKERRKRRHKDRCPRQHQGPPRRRCFDSLHQWHPPTLRLLFKILLHFLPELVRKLGDWREPDQKAATSSNAIDVHRANVSKLLDPPRLCTTKRQTCPPGSLARSRALQFISLQSSLSISVCVCVHLSLCISLPPSLPPPPPSQ